MHGIHRSLAVRTDIMEFDDAAPAAATVVRTATLSWPVRIVGVDDAVGWRNRKPAVGAEKSTGLTVARQLSRYRTAELPTVPNGAKMPTRRRNERAGYD